MEKTLIIDSEQINKTDEGGRYQRLPGGGGADAVVVVPHVVVIRLKHSRHVTWPTAARYENMKTDRSYDTGNFPLNKSIKIF